MTRRIVVPGLKSQVFPRNMLDLFPLWNAISGEQHSTPETRRCTDTNERVRVGRFQLLKHSAFGNMDRSVIHKPAYKPQIDPKSGKIINEKTGIDEADKFNAQGVSPQN
jgi:hypothetical protein